MILKKIRSRVNKARSKIHEHFKSRHRSSRWDDVRDNYLLVHAQCEACGGIKSLQVHHIVPFHVDPNKELDPDNLVTLCMGDYDCHLTVGHGGSFRHYNPDVREDVKRFLLLSKEERAKLVKEIRKKRARD